MSEVDKCCRGQFLFRRSRFLSLTIFREHSSYPISPWCLHFPVQREDFGGSCRSRRCRKKTSISRHGGLFTAVVLKVRRGKILVSFHSFGIVVIYYSYFIRISFCVSLKIHGLPIPYHIANGPNLLSLYSETNGNHGTLYIFFLFLCDSPILIEIGFYRFVVGRVVRAIWIWERCTASTERGIAPKSSKFGA